MANCQFSSSHKVNIHGIISINAHHCTNALLLVASSYDQDDKNTYKKTIYVKTTTTKPPIVWFPGDPDCGEGDLGGNSKMDTFQLIAFLLSIFNVASIMVSNVNNNNNNNNINDNGDNVNDNNINESNTNAMVSSMSNVGLMGKRKRRSVAHLGPETSNLIMEEELHKTIWDMFSLVIKSHLMRSITCLEKLFCEASASVMTRGGFSAVVAEMSSLAISKSLPNLNRDQERRIVQAGKYGRAGLNCSEIFDKCEEENWNFSNMAEAFTWSPVASLTSMEKLVSWAYNKK